jgi:ParB/RepB/Spo0J family partition protein
MPSFQVTEEVILIPIGRLLDNKLNEYIRGDTITEESCQELADSIKVKGVTVPLLVMPYRQGFYIIHGHRRRFSARMAGLTEVPCIIRHNLSEDEQFDLMLNENLQRKDLTLLAEARCFQKLVDEGNTVPEIKRRTGLAKARITNLLFIATLEPEIQSLFENGRLNINAAAHIVKLPDSTSRLYLARNAVRYQWAIKTIESKVAQWQPVDEDDHGKKKARRRREVPLGTLTDPDGSRLTKSQALARFDDNESFSLSDLKRAILGSCCDNCDEKRYPQICLECPTSQILATLLDMKNLRHLPQQPPATATDDEASNNPVPTTDSVN